MNFSQALDRIKWGQPMSRELWADPRTYVYRPNPPDESTLRLRTDASDNVWTPSVEDVMALDWFDVPRID